MKEIGEFLRSSRISNGVSVEEAAEDLKFSTVQLENVEDGNIRAFKDIYALREIVRSYAKYLGLETDKIIDEFNDFMFEHTSKISLDDILQARKLAKEKNIEEKEKIVSPYTHIKKNKLKLSLKKIKTVLITIGIIIGLFLTIYIWFKAQTQKEKISSELMGERWEKVNECAY